MALYDSADCVVRFRDAAQLPDVDESLTDAAIYRLLTDAQVQWFHTIAGMVPGALYGEPELLYLTGSDDGVTYDFGTDIDSRPIVPYGPIELYRTESDARQPEGARGWALQPGVDFAVYGERVVVSPTHAPSFVSTGPWARYIEPPGLIDDAHEPTLLPVAARRLMILSAVEAWADQGGLRDPNPYSGQAMKLWAGDPTVPSDIGMQGVLKMQYYAPVPPRWGNYWTVNNRGPLRFRGGY